MDNKKYTNIIILIMLLVTLVVTLLVYPSLPDSIPTHWGPSGEIDAIGPKYTVFLGLGVAVLCNWLMLFSEKIEPKQGSYAKFGKVFNIFRLFITVLMCCLQLLTIAFAFNPQVANMNTIMYPSIGFMFILLGNYMPKVKHNYTFGIKTPWTFASENVWNKTHRMCGPVWILGGLAMASLAFVKNTTAAAVIMFAIIAVLVVVPMVYSYVEYQKEIKENEKDN